MNSCTHDTLKPMLWMQRPVSTMFLIKHQECMMMHVQHEESQLFLLFILFLWEIMIKFFNRTWRAFKLMITQATGLFHLHKELDRYLASFSLNNENMNKTEHQHYWSNNERKKRKLSFSQLVFLHSMPKACLRSYS